MNEKICIIKEGGLVLMQVLMQSNLWEKLYCLMNILAGYQLHFQGDLETGRQ